MNARNDEKTHILVVDDQQGLRDTICELLEMSGYKTEQADGGKKAVQLLGAYKYDLVLLDLQMPDLSGEKVLEYIQSKSLSCKTIIVSGETNFDNVKAALEKGAHDYIRKPYEAEELLATVKRATQNITLEKEKDILHEALVESEKFHRYIVDNSPDIVYMLDERGFFTFINKTVEELLNIPREEVVGKHYSTLVFEEDLPKANYVFNERRSGDRASRNVEIRLKTNHLSRGVKYFDTRVLPIELNSTGIYNSQTREDQASFVGTYGTARDISERKQIEEIINFQAYHDMLTALPNRTLFQDRLSQAIAHARRYEQLLAVMFLDLDRFKMVNDSMGHAAGDNLLQQVTDRIQSCLREEDTLARFGGDEFTLLLPSIKRNSDAATIAQKIIDTLEVPFLINDHELYISASIGIAVFPKTGESMETLFQNADIAMYHVKRNGKSGYQFFSNSMDEAFSQRMTMERDIRRGLEENQFQVHFQPKVSSLNGNIVGMEALVRWNHPDKGLIYPGEFISLAEETKLIVPLGKWVFEHTCMEMARWKKEGIPAVKVSVNVSSLQIAEKDFIGWVLDTVDLYGLNGSQFEFEITESVLMKNRETLLRRFRQLDENGFSIAIDDFGTGYSSLSYLQSFPVHTLKIDKSFIDDIGNANDRKCLVDAIVSMAKGLHLNLVAEGVETKEQMIYLRNLGCHEIQGFYFSAAESGDNIMEMMNNDGPEFGSQIN